MIDDILALILIGVVSGAATGNLGLATLGLVVGALGFVGLGFAIARRARGLPREVFTWPLFADTPLVPVFLVMLGLAILAAFIGLAAIIGAFVAGLIIAETEAQDEIEHDIKPLASIITPFFFAVDRRPARPRSAHGAAARDRGGRPRRSWGSPRRSPPASSGRGAPAAGVR